MIYYCCKSFRNLNKLNYIETDNKGQPAVYLQSIEAKTKIPQDLRHYRYCIGCGTDTALHPITILKDPNKCDMLKKGLIQKKIALNFGQKGMYEKAKENYKDLPHDHYIFNLNSLTEVKETQSNITDYYYDNRLDTRRVGITLHYHFGSDLIKGNNKATEEQERL